VNENVERNPFLKAALNIYAPFKFNELRARYYEEHRAVHQEMNVPSSKRNIGGFFLK
jgi:hypothetical protein